MCGITSVRHWSGSRNFSNIVDASETALDEWTVAPVISVSSGAPFTATVSGNAFVPTGFTRVQSGILGAGGPAAWPIVLERIQMPRIANVDLVLQEITIWESIGLELFGELLIS